VPCHIVKRLFGRCLADKTQTTVWLRSICVCDDRLWLSLSNVLALRATQSMTLSVGQTPTDSVLSTGCLIPKRNERASIAYRLQTTVWLISVYLSDDRLWLGLVHFCTMCQDIVKRLFGRCLADKTLTTVWLRSVCVCDDIYRQDTDCRLA
jgi:hypothetical protein